MNWLEKLTRRKFIRSLISSAGFLFLAGCGAGGKNSEKNNNLSVVATKEETVFDASVPMTIESVYSATVTDDFIVKVGRLSGDLVFEINGQQLVGQNVSARRVKVFSGDLITWKTV